MEQHEPAVHRPIEWLKLQADIHEKLYKRPHPDPVPTFGADLVERPGTPIETEQDSSFLTKLDKALRDLDSDRPVSYNFHGSATKKRCLSKRSETALTCDELSSSDAEELSDKPPPYAISLYEKTFGCSTKARTRPLPSRKVQDLEPQRKRRCVGPVLDMLPSARSRPRYTKQTSEYTIYPPHKPEDPNCFFLVQFWGPSWNMAKCKSPYRNDTGPSARSIIEASTPPPLKPGNRLHFTTDEGERSTKRQKLD